MYKAQRRSGRGNFPAGISHVDFYKVFGPAASPQVCDGSVSWQTLALSGGWGVTAQRRGLDCKFVSCVVAVLPGQPLPQGSGRKRDKMLVNSNIKGGCNELNTLN